MASREKKPLAPSKSKQKANNDSGLPSNEIKSKKGKVPSITQQQLAHDILEAVATDGQLPPKLEASLPRKKVLKNLARKQKLKVAKASLIKTKVTKKVANKNLRRINTDIKKGVKARKINKSEDDSLKIVDINSKISENHVGNTESEGKVTETPGKSAKNNLRTKKRKTELRVSKSVWRLLCGDTEDKDTDGVKSSPKLNRKAKTGETSDSALKSAKQSVKVTNLKKNTTKDKEVPNKSVEADKCPKGRKNSIKDTDCSGIAKSVSGVDPKLSKSVLDSSKSSIDLTIDEVIASMLSDSETDNQGATEKVEGKVTRSKRMLVDESIPDIEIKKEPESEDNQIDGEYVDVDQSSPLQNVIQLRKRSSISGGPTRSLRNGKLRQLSDSGISTEPDFRKRRRLNSDDPVNSETSTEHVSDGNIDTESCFSELSGNEPQSTLTNNKDDVTSIKDELQKNFDDVVDNGEIENNNNSERVDRIGEVGPTLRSKTKAKSIEGDVKTEDTKVLTKNESTEDSKKGIDQIKKDGILAKLTDKSKGRRNSLNIDMKKTVHSFYGTEKSEGTKSQIDQMIENIKLTIAKSIESKIFGPEKGLGLNKNFEVPKIEEIVAPLSTESQKLGLEESTDEDKPNPTKNEIKSENSENSIPKVADTAKEIEKLVMGDIELAETKSQNTQENNSNNNAPKEAQSTKHDQQNTCNPVNSSGNNEDVSENTTSQASNCSSNEDTEAISKDNCVAHQSKSTDDKKVTITRKSLRNNDKGCSENSSDSDTSKKVNKTPCKSNQKINEDEETPTETDKVANSEDPPQTEKSDSEKEENTNSDKINSEEISTAPPIQTEEKSVEEVNQTDSSTVPSDKSPEHEETETLESISSEVEKLVADAQNPINAKTTTDSTEKSDIASTNSEDSNCENTSEDVVQENLTAEESNSAKSVESAVEQTVDAVTKSAETKDTLESTTDNSETNCNTLINENCDPSPEDNSEKEVSQDTSISKESNESENSKSELNETKEIPKHNNEENNDHNDSDIDKSLSNKKLNSSGSSTEVEKDKPVNSEKTLEEQKQIADENKRVLRARDKLKKIEKRQTSRSRERIENATKTKTDEDVAPQQTNTQSENGTEQPPEEKNNTENLQNKETGEEISKDGIETESNDLSESQGRTRRNREAKKRKEDQLQSVLKTKRNKREFRKSDQQKEETLLDNEVAEINENNRSFLENYSNEECTDNFRGFSEVAQNRLEEIQDESLRSKSENDIILTGGPSKPNCDGLLSRNLSENHVSEETDILNNECKTVKTPETLQKDSDEASTSGESSSSVHISTKILETPEDKARKESILRLLGLESLEKAAERLSNQKARKEQYTGTLKTVIRVQKEKEKEKDKDRKRSRSPLKMVLKQGRGDGEGDSPEFYTIQKEFGTSGLGDSSSGANRKFTTNHRHSCDEDNEEAPPKDRQSLVIPEKSSSFSIHPGRLCADVCCYCFGKFGSLDTPMHLAQMKSDERRKKILNVERHLTKDSCLCDACYRHVDRKANTSPTNMQTKPQNKHRQLMVSKCTARDCRDPARHHVKRRWLLKIKAGLQNQVDIDWESSQHSSMSFCVNHYAKIERFLTCALCKRRLARNHTHQLGSTETDELNERLSQQGIPVVLAAGTFVCKMCRYFTQLRLKYKDVENMNTNHKAFVKSYRKRILHYHDIEIMENDDEDPSSGQSKDKEKRKKAAKCNSTGKNGNSKSPDVSGANSASEKSTPEPVKNESTNSETENENRAATKPSGTSNETMPMDVQYLGIESAVEKLKKRKLLDMHYSTDTSVTCEPTNEVVEILAMDKEVTLTRVPKRQKTNDITPVVQRLGANPSISVRTLFPGEEEMNLHANIEFANVREITPQGWEKCATMIQYDRDTKLLWQELQRPYGNQSSFLRHLILLEKYYRSGDLVLAPNASRNAINYSTSVQNRLISYEGPEKMDEPIMEPISSEFTNSRRLSGGYVVERDRYSLPSTSAMKTSTSTSQTSKGSPSRVLKLNPGVSIIKKPPPSLQRLSLPSTSTSNGNVCVKRKENQKSITSGGKVFQLTEPDYKRFQNLKKQKQLLNDKQSVGSPGSASSNSPPIFKSTSHYQKAQMAAQSQFQKHLRMQQEMLSRQSRGDFEPLICDMRSLTNENTPTQNLLHNLNLPKSIQVTTKPSPNPIPILPKIPKSLTVIPQTVTRPSDK